MYELRLQLHVPANATSVAGDTKALIGGPYSGHFCSVPHLVEPGIVAPSMLRSGVPAGSTVAFVPERGEMRVSGHQSGFHVVRFTHGVWPAFRTMTAQEVGDSGAQLPAMGAPAALGLVALVLLGILTLGGRRTR